MMFHPRHPYSPIGSFHDHTRRHRKLKTWMMCVSFAILLGLLVLIILQRIHTMKFLKKSHNYLINASHIHNPTTCMGYPEMTMTMKDLFVPIEKQIIVKMKEYRMQNIAPDGNSINFYFSIDEIIPRDHTLLSSSTPHLYLHRYLVNLLPDAHNLSSMQLLFLSLEGLPEQLIISDAVNNSEKCCRVTFELQDSIRSMWASTSVQEFRNLLQHNISIPSESLRNAIVPYFRTIQSFGEMVYLEPLAKCDTIVSDYYCVDRNQFAGVSAAVSTVFMGVSTRSNEPCTGRVELIHAYLFDSKKEIIGILAMSDLRQLKDSLSTCNFLGTIEHAMNVLSNYSASSRRLYELSPAFKGTCKEV